jgi:hypothetical protein
MAKKKKSSAESKPEPNREQPAESDESTGEASADLERLKRRNVAMTATFVAIAFSILGFVGWHRPRDVGRQWYKRAQDTYNQRVQTAFQRCFGATDGTALRAGLPLIRRGTFPPQLRACRGASLTEATAMPLAFASGLGPAPGYAENQKLRVIDAVERFRTSITSYERAVDALGAGDGTTVPDAARDGLASALDQLATDMDGIRNAMRDLGVVVEDNASWY